MRVPGFECWLPARSLAAWDARRRRVSRCPALYYDLSVLCRRCSRAEESAAVGTLGATRNGRARIRRRQGYDGPRVPRPTNTEKLGFPFYVTATAGVVAVIFN